MLKCYHYYSEAQTLIGFTALLYVSASTIALMHTTDRAALSCHMGGDGGDVEIVSPLGIVTVALCLHSVLLVVTISSGSCTLKRCSCILYFCVC